MQVPHEYKNLLQNLQLQVFQQFVESSSFSLAENYQDKIEEKNVMKCIFQVYNFYWTYNFTGMVLPLKIMMRLYALIMILYKLYILGSRFKGL